jgi:hypothetical protein
LDGGLLSCTAEPTVDPLKVHVVLQLRDELPKGCWNALQTLAHAYAGANDCLISKIKKRGKRSYVAEVLTKKRLGPEMTNDPFLMDDWKSGAQKRREKYIQMLRDKGVDIEKGLLK